jgi:hypothetical protein
MVSVIVVMRLFCAGIVATQKPDPAILHGTTAIPPESVPLPAREQQSRHNQHRDTGQSYPDGFHDLRQNPPISKPCREVFGFPSPPKDRVPKSCCSLTRIMVTNNALVSPKSDEGGNGLISKPRTDRFIIPKIRPKKLSRSIAGPWPD